MTAHTTVVAPFLFARSDFVTQETGPWHENGQTWRRLLVTYPDTIVAHTRQQTCYFDDAGLLRRLDYSVDIPGGIFPDYELTDHTKI